MRRATQYLLPLFFGLLLTPGCREPASYQLHLLLPDQVAEQLAARLHLWALAAPATGCGALDPSTFDPAAVDLLAELALQAPFDRAANLDELQPGPVVFAARGYTAEEATILWGCTRAELERGERTEVTLPLEWSCRPTIEGEGPAGAFSCRNDRDDDCDGLEDLEDPDCQGPPDAGVPDAASPDAAGADAGAPDTSTPDAAVVDVVIDDVGIADTTLPDLAAPDLTTSDLTTPDTAAPDAAEEDSGAGPPPAENLRSIGSSTSVLYDTGTATIAAGSRVLVLGGGATLPAPGALGAVGPGDALTLDPGAGDEELHYVLSRDSATQLTLQAPAQRDHSDVAFSLARAFNTLAAWERNRDGDLVADNRREIGLAYKDGPLFAFVDIKGSTTSVRHFMKLTAAPGQGHRGVAGGGVVLDGQDLPEGIAVGDDYTVVERLELVRVRGSHGVAAVIVDSGVRVLLQDLLIHDFVDPGFTVIGVKGSDDSEFILRNSIIYDGDAAAIRLNRSTAVARVESCTLFDMVGYGVYEELGVAHVINTIAMNTGQEGYWVTLGDGSHNISSDDTAAGTGSLINLIAADMFVSIAEGAEDLHLKAGADAIDAGADLSASFTVDIDGDARPGGAGTWDIGADELP